MSEEEDSGVIDIKSGRHLTKAEVNFMLEAPERPSLAALIGGFGLCAASFGIPWVWSQMSSILVTIKPNNAVAELFSTNWGLIYGLVVFIFGLLTIFMNLAQWQ